MIISLTNRKSLVLTTIAMLGLAALTAGCSNSSEQGPAPIVAVTAPAQKEQLITELENKPGVSPQEVAAAKAALGVKGTGPSNPSQPK